MKKIRWLLLLFFFCFLLSEFYGWIAHKFTVTVVLAALYVNISLLVLTYFYKPPLRQPKNSLVKPRYSLLINYLPLILIATMVFVALFTKFFINSSQPASSGGLAWSFFSFIPIFVIPIVEELLFRWKLSGFCQRVFGIWSGRYCCILIFAFLHTNPQFADLEKLSLGLAIGPFLLALTCESLVYWSQSIYPAIFFHMACNGSVFIFSMLDSRWLHWLGGLYSI